MDLLNELRCHLKDDDMHKVETVQALWSGYGEIARYYSPKKDKHFIVKQVTAPEKVSHPRGWNTQASHERKLHSYQVERSFYQEYATLCDRFCRVPDTILVAENGLLILEDLDESGFVVRRENGESRSVELGIRWIAYFHARFLQHAGHSLWPVGTYWHLGTRLDELQAMEKGSLKNYAESMDQKLNQARYQTLVHGDAKLANFCFHLNGEDLAAVDFQYVGRGVGVKDLAYFLGCCFNSGELMEREADLLECYFNHLQIALNHYQIPVDWESLKLEWTELYPLAWADFYRFLAGWSPGHYKINSYMHRQFEKVEAVLTANK